MPLKRLLLILASVICAAFITIWLARLVGDSLGFSWNSWVIILPILLLGLVLWRLIAERRK